MSKDKNGIVGWNSSYFGQAKEGSLLDTINNITTKQNELVGGKPEVADSQVVAAQKEKRSEERRVGKEGKSRGSREQ